MKTKVLNASFAATLLCLTPLVSNAQNVSGPPTGKLEKSSLGRLTLLPGPTLLSPARTTPTMMPSPIKLDSTPGFNFVPAKEQFLPGREGSLRLIDRNAIEPHSLSRRPTVQPSGEFLRFDATIEPMPESMRWQFKRGPKQ
jgi:hypothetical protein